MTPAPGSLVFALRQSPDWAALAADRAAGIAIDSARYIPPHDVPTFPANIETCISGWNAWFNVDFFACRAELQRIARTTLDAVQGGVVLARPDWVKGLSPGPFRLFFLDDDDWFAPDTLARMAAVGDEDIAVFPLLRLDWRVFTFVRELRPASPVIGFPSRFSHRYQTNNYALHSRLCTPETLALLADHMIASAEADRLALRDRYHDVLVSATNKTPASASVVARLPGDPAAFRVLVQDFVAAFRSLDLPDHAAWMREPVRLTADLFDRALGRG